jgi:ATP-dependent Lhr-like helicase
MPLTDFHAAIAAWFGKQFAEPTEPQAEAWPAIKSGRPTLIAAPTGSGKRLEASLSAIDDLVRQSVEGTLDFLGRGRLRVVRCDLEIVGPFTTTATTNH